MRAIALVVAAALASLAAAQDRYVCTSPPAGDGWSCAQGNGEAIPQTVPVARDGSADARLRATANARRLDWVPRNELLPDGAAMLDRHCDGAYVEPPFPFDLDGDDRARPIEAQANAIEYRLGDRAELTGGVRVSRGNASLVSGAATYYEEERRVVVAGDATLRQPGLLVYGSDAEYLLDSGAAQVRDAEFVLQQSHMRGTANALRQEADRTLIAEHARITRCEPGNEGWTLGARSVEIRERDSHGTARHAVLRVGRVPVMYTPYIRFPVTDERLSGFLFPDLTYDSNDGIDVALPYYWNLAPNYDATITPRYVAERGGGGELEIRHLSRWTRTELGGALLYDDDLYNGELSRDEFRSQGLTGPFEPDDRWLGRIEHDGRFGDFGTAISFTKVSDEDYFRDLGTDLSMASQVELEQRAQITFDHGGLSMRLWGQDFQNLDAFAAQPYRRLPEFAARYRGRLPGPFEWSLAAATAQFDRDTDGLSGVDRLTGIRHHVEPRLELPLVWPFGFVRLGSGFRYTAYELDDVDAGFEEDPDREIWFGTADAGLFFERDTTIFGRAHTHTLEPRIYYLVQERAEQSALPLFDSTDLTFGYQQLFRDNRFTGLDRIGDANQLAIGMTTRLLDAADGRERLRASVGQIVYFEDRHVTLGDVDGDDSESSSALAGEIAYAIGGNWRHTTTAVFDPHDSTWDEAGTHLQYRSNGGGLFNLGYRARRDVAPRIEQADVSLYWPLLRHWSVLGRWNYDVEDERLLETFAGIEYQNCCWLVRAVGRRFLSSPEGPLAPDPTTDEGVFLQVVFKGLAGFGGRIDALMENGIRGYRSRGRNTEEY